MSNRKRHRDNREKFNERMQEEGYAHGVAGFPKKEKYMKEGTPVSRATYETAHEMGSDDRSKDPKYAARLSHEVTQEAAARGGMKEHEQSHWGKGE